MPPKRSDLHHVTFHFYRSAVLLSLPAATSITTLKKELIPALQPFKSILPVSIPKSPSDIQLYEQKEPVEGADTTIATVGLRNIEEDEKDKVRGIAALGWPRWKTLYVSFRGEDGTFGEPIYTVPDVEDGEAEDGQE